MADAYPTVDQVLAGVVYGPDGAPVTGTLALATQASVDALQADVDDIKTQTDKIQFTGTGVDAKVNSTATVTAATGLTAGSKVGHFRIMGRHTPVYFNPPTEGK